MKPVNSDLREIRPITTPLQGDMFTMMKLVNSDIREIRLVTAPLQDVGEVDNIGCVIWFIVLVILMQMCL